jgi:hypothetical protein
MGEARKNQIAGHWPGREPFKGYVIRYPHISLPKSGKLPRLHATSSDWLNDLGFSSACLGTIFSSNLPVIFS